MARVYISFLGTNDYLPCRYQWKNNDPSNVVRFVQETTLDVFCRFWTADDRVLIFTTRDAKKRNWLDDGQDKPKTPGPLGREGLEKRIGYLKRLRCPVERIDIPDGRNESEIWEIFQILYDNLREGDEIVFDVTHAFRSIPMLAIVALHYAKVLKGVELAGIYYGAFEALGAPAEVERNIPDPKQRIAPILDLTSVSKLLEWTLAIDRFVSSGDASLVGSLADRGVSNILKETKGRSPSAQTIRGLGKALTFFSKTMTTCRGRDISAAAEQLKRLINDSKELGVLPPFVPLFDRIRTRMKGFKGDEITDGIEAARWCFEHNLIQQAFTILQETLTGYLVAAVYEDPLVLKNREVALQAVKIYRKSLPESQWKAAAADNPKLVRQLLGRFEKIPQWTDTMWELGQYRNDLNHAGYGENPMKADKFVKNLKKVLHNVDRQFG